MNRQELAAYLTGTYSVEGEHLFAQYPSFLVFRHIGNRKWFAVIMDIPRKNLKLPGKGEIITPVLDAATKTLTFETDKFSTYALVYIDLENTPPTQETTPPTDIPATGDSVDMIMWATMLVMSSIAIIVLLANRKRFMYKAKYVRK